METKKIKAGVEYATCDGQLIVPVAPVQRGWYTEYNPKTRDHDLLFTEEIDPWGGCMNAKKPITTGLKCTKYETDRNGSKLENTAAVHVIDPRDVKGLWKDFLVLHGEKVRRRADDRTQEEAQEAFQSSLDQVELPGTEASKIGVDWHYGWDAKTGKHVGGKVRRMYVVLDADNVDDFTTFVKKAGGKLPKEAVDYLRENFMTKSEFDAFIGKKGRR